MDGFLECKNTYISSNLHSSGFCYCYFHVCKWIFNSNFNAQVNVDTRGQLIISAGLVAKLCCTPVSLRLLCLAPRQAPLSMGFSRQEYWSVLLFLLQRILLTHESNPGLLHGRQILYQLSYEGNPCYLIPNCIAYLVAYCGMDCFNFVN